ncbi:MAG: hypothetical protein OSB21_09625 [Myxococcota bacterium]|nr:hypothetical protein [Myxococcota bacterium]
MRWVFLIAALLLSACADDNAEMLCVRHSQCPMLYFCWQGRCYVKNSAPQVEVVLSSDSGTIDSGLSSVDSGLVDATTDAGSTDATALDGASSDATVDAGSSDVASIDVSSNSDAALGDLSSLPDADQLGDSGVPSDGPSDSGATDATPGAAPDAAFDTGGGDGPIRDVPPSDRGPDTGITDRGFGSFPLPSFDTGFGKPR